MDAVEDCGTVVESSKTYVSMRCCLISEFIPCLNATLCNATKQSYQADAIEGTSLTAISAYKNRVQFSFVRSPRQQYNMGYTHYWRIASAEPIKRVWPQLITNANLIIQEAGIKLCRYGDGDEEIPPPLNDKSITLNGAELSHEPFILKPEVTKFDFCKTARKEYDVVATAILLRAYQLIGEAIDVR